MNSFDVLPQTVSVRFNLPEVSKKKKYNFFISYKRALNVSQFYFTVCILGQYTCT